MKEQILQQYQALMGSLYNLPADIAVAQSDLADIKRQAADTKRLLEQHEQAMVLQIGGKNAEERKANLCLALADNTTFQRLTAAQRKEQQDIDAITIEADMLTRQYGAVCFQAQLLAGLMQYLSNAKAPVEVLPTDSLGDVVFAPRANGNTYVTADDAAAIGL
jgi:hypothetical protein